MDNNSSPDAHSNIGLEAFGLIAGETPGLPGNGVHRPKVNAALPAELDTDDAASGPAHAGGLSAAERR